MKELAEFSFNKEKQTITCKMRYRGDYVYGVAKLNKNEEYDEEFGKALAFARAEEVVRTREVKAAGDMKEVLAWEYAWQQTDDAALASLVSKHVQIAAECLKKYQKYLRHQRAMIKLMETTEERFSKEMNYKDILKEISDSIFSQERIKNEKLFLAREELKARKKNKSSEIQEA